MLKFINRLNDIQKKNRLLFYGTGGLKQTASIGCLHKRHRAEKTEKKSVDAGNNIQRQVALVQSLSERTAKCRLQNVSEREYINLIDSLQYQTTVLLTLLSERKVPLCGHNRHRSKN